MKPIFRIRTADGRTILAVEAAVRYGDPVEVIVETNDEPFRY